MLPATNISKNGKKEIWVLAEKQGERWDQVTLELLHDAQTLAKNGNLNITAIVFSKPEAVTEKDGQALASHGAQEVIVLENEQFCQANGPLTYTNLLVDLVEQRQVQMLLCPSTPLWIDCVSTIVPKIDATIVTNVISFRLKEEELEATRYVFKDNAQMTVKLPDDKRWIVCLRPNVAGVGAAKRGQKAEIIHIPVSQQAREVQIEELFSPDPRALDLVEADRIVAGGRGIGSEGFELLEDLALLLEAGVGATRVAVDQGWIPYSRQIGQTGKTVKPRLYIAIGISGAAQHVDGMRDSEVIIVINKDPDAKIYDLADLSVVGDAHEIIKELIKLLNEKSKTMMDVG